MRTWQDCTSSRKAFGTASSSMLVAPQSSLGLTALQLAPTPTAPQPLASSTQRVAVSTSISGGLKSFVGWVQITLLPRPSQGLGADPAASGSLQTNPAIQPCQ